MAYFICMQCTVYIYLFTAVIDVTLYYDSGVLLPPPSNLTINNIDI